MVYNGIILCYMLLNGIAWYSMQHYSGTFTTRQCKELLFEQHVCGQDGTRAAPPGHANSPGPKSFAKSECWRSERGDLWMPDTGVAKVGTGGDAICKIRVFFLDNTQASQRWAACKSGRAALISFLIKWIITLGSI